MERMLLQASLHVRMAAVQRELYVYHIILAEEHALTHKPHHQRLNFGRNDCSKWQ